MVSRKVAKHCSNGLICSSEVQADLPEEPLSPDSESCLKHAEQIVEELLACSARPPSGDSSDSGKGSLLESTSDFSPTTGQRKSWSTPASPTFQGIVKQRLKNFQALNETASDTESVVSNPCVEITSPKVYKNEEFELEIKEINKSIKTFYTAMSNDENFNSAIMEGGYVKALVAKINHNKLKPAEKCEESVEEADQNDNIEDLNDIVKLTLGEEDSGWDQWEQEVGGEENGRSVDEEDVKSTSDCRSSINGVSLRSKNNTPVPYVRSSSGSSVVSLPSRTNSVNSSRTNSTSESSESHVSRALRRFNTERSRSLPKSRLSSFSTNTPFSYSHIKSPPKLCHLKHINGDSKTLHTNGSCITHGASFSPHAKNRKCVSCDMENSDQSAGQTGSHSDKRGCVSQSLDFGLLPLNPADLFDENWAKCDLSFEDFDLEEASKQKVRWCKA